MADNDDDCVKRIVKASLYFKGEASTEMILNHINDAGYGIRKAYTKRGLSSKIAHWNKTSKSGAWFRVEPFTKNRKRWWRLIK